MSIAVDFIVWKEKKKENTENIWKENIGRKETDMQ